MKNKPVYVLGTGLSHDSSTVLLKDGVVCVGIEKERLSRIKHDNGNDTLAIQYCLDAEGISLEDIDLVVQTANFEIPDAAYHQGPRLFTTPDHPPVINISHHLAHAYSAIGTCPFDECYVMVIDGCGSPFSQYREIHPELPGDFMADFSSTSEMLCEKDSFYHFDGQHLRTLQKDFSPMAAAEAGKPHFPTTRHSIGGFYSAVSHYVFGNMDDVGKLMGLAPFGKAGTIVQDVFYLENSRLMVRDDWNLHLTRPSYSYDHFLENFEYYANVACWAQEEVEKAVVWCIKNRLGNNTQSKLCFSGGVALNAVANARLLKNLGHKHVYFEPAAADNGLALGCAYYGWLAHLQQARVKHNGTTCFGRSYRPEEIEKAIRPYAHKWEVRDLPEEELLISCAKSLCKGQTIAWFQEGSEFGPRALGRRSILAHPGIQGLQQHINRHIKFREDFRPFAPAVQEEKVDLFFENGIPSPYMILIDQTRDEYLEKLSNVTHRNGSARVQTVSRKWNLRFWKLIEESVSPEIHFGDASISKKHRNFFVNKGNAKSQDMKKLINYVKDKVMLKTGVNLELEIILVE